MSTIRVKIETDGFLQAREGLLRISSAVEVDRDALDEIGDYLATRIRMAIASGNTPWGERFKPLSSISKDQRFRGGKRYTKRGYTTSKYFRHMTGPHEPLNDTGLHIRERVTHRVEPGAVSVGILDSENAKIGRVHQWGATIVPKRAKWLAIPFADGIIRAKKAVIPARPFLPIRPGGNVDLPPSWRDGVLGLLAARIAAALKD